MLDLTGVDVPERPELRHLVARSARAIEDALLLSRPHDWLMRLNWPGGALGGESDGLVTLDDDGQVLGTNTTARQLLPLPLRSPGGALHSADVFAMPWAMLRDAACQQRSAAMPVPLWSGLRLQAWCNQLQQFRAACASPAAPFAADRDRADPPGGARRPRQCGRGRARTGHQPRHGVPQARAVCGKVLNKNEPPERTSKAPAAIKNRANQPTAAQPSIPQRQHHRRFIHLQLDPRPHPQAAACRRKAHHLHTASSCAATSSTSGPRERRVTRPSHQFTQQLATRHTASPAPPWPCTAPTRPAQAAGPAARRFQP